MPHRVFCNSIFGGVLLAVTTSLEVPIEARQNAAVNWRPKILFVVRRIGRKNWWLSALVLTGLPAFLSAYLNAEPLRLTRPEATFHAGAADELSFVVDSVAAGPRGWSPAPKAYEKQALVVRCERPVEAAELDVTLFFLAGRPMNPLAQFSISYTTDDEPSLHGNWQPLEITRFSSDVNTLRRTPEGTLHIDFFPNNVTGNTPDDVYRLVTRLSGGRATGFRLDAIPVQLPGTETRALSWWPPHDFTLTEFRVAVHVRETTNIALYQPVTASHKLFVQQWLGTQQQASSLTDGLPATIAHPDDPNLGPAFFFEIDLGRLAILDHFNLRNRGDEEFNRMNRLRLKWFDQPPAEGASPTWQAFHRADGSDPTPGAVEVLRDGNGSGIFRGRYLRISTESTVPLSPQIAEVEVYERRTPMLVAARADGRLLVLDGKLEVPPDTRRLALEVKIPQPGMPPNDVFRWHIPGEVDVWQGSSRMTIDMACPEPGRHVFEAQAMHSDGEWDASLYQMPILVRQHWWKSGWFRWTSGFLTTGLAIGIGMLWSRRRAARQLTRMKAEHALAEERARIARDLHDEIGANLTHISILSTLASEAATGPETSRQHNAEVASCARETIQAFDEILWSVNPKNDTLPSLCHYVCRRAEEMLSPAGLTYRFNVQDPMPDLPLPPNSRHQLLLAVKETLHNIIKHARARHVHVRCELEDHRSLRIGIQDDGCGFDPSSICPTPGQRHGMGLEDIRHRLTSLGGECHIESTPGQGTRVTLLLPL